MESEKKLACYGLSIVVASELVSEDFVVLLYDKIEYESNDLSWCPRRRQRNNQCKDC